MPVVIPQQYLTYRIIGCDPGLNNFGVSVFEIDAIYNNIISIDAFTIQVDRLQDMTGLDTEFYSERTIKLYKLKQAVIELLVNIGPSCLACEGPFYNRFRPMAYGALVEVVSVIHSAIIDYNPNIYFTTIQPLLVKKIVGAGSTKGKLDVDRAIRNIPEIMDVLRCDLSKLDEHSKDAIAVGYSFYKNLGV